MMEDAKLLCFQHRFFIRVPVCLKDTGKSTISGGSDNGTGVFRFTTNDGLRMLNASGAKSAPSKINQYFCFDGFLVYILIKRDLKEGKNFQFTF